MSYDITWLYVMMSILQPNSILTEQNLSLFIAMSVSGEFVNIQFRMVLIYYYGATPVAKHLMYLFCVLIRFILIYSYQKALQAKL